MKSLFLSATLAAFVLGGPAAAQIATNSRAPVDVTADELEVVNNCEAVWRGSAEALQETSRLRADVLKIIRKSTPGKAGSQAQACGDMDRMEAQGSVYYVTPDQKVRANSAVYEAGSTTITMSGDVIAIQGQNVLRGDRMVFNTQTGAGQMQGGGKGHGAKNRPRGVFYPSQPASAPPATK